MSDDNPDYTKAGGGVHHTTHETGGSDEVSVSGLFGVLSEEQYSAWAKISGIPSTFPPEGHHAKHEIGGTDEVAGLVPEYVAGTWAPKVYLGATEVTSYNFQVGTYTVIGNRCILSGHVSVNAVGAGTGDVSVQNLPKTPKNRSNGRIAIAIMMDAVKGLTTESIQAQVREDAPYLRIYRFTGGALYALTNANMQTNTNIRFNCSYEI